MSKQKQSHSFFLHLKRMEKLTIQLSIISETQNLQFYINRMNVFKLKKIFIHCEIIKKKKVHCSYFK